MSNPGKDKKDPVKQLQEKPGKNEFLIVGIGASAGGIQALHEFFKNVPPASGMAYVVILHLSPDHDSSLAQVLQQVTKIPVTQVTEKVRIKPNQIYVVPPNRHLTMKDSHIIVSPNTLVEDRRAPVDLFFRTLADEMGPRAVCVVLSGTGANGSMGLKRIKERGGTTFVQNPREAEFNEMPRHSIATDLVDEVLPVADIPAKIMAYKNSMGTVEIAEEAEKRPEDQQQALRGIFTLLRTKTGHDFSNYKHPTLLRRIERRINVHNLPDLPAYSKYIRENLEETTALLKDLLISVTNFYRDKQAFDVIESEVLPLILKQKTGEDEIRIWVAGCATGEEAYSIAMLCAEKISDIADAPKVQIFATDIDESAIAHARDGYYTLNDAADVSPERLRRFFNKEADGYRIKREIRETVMFAFHNFLKDPPFSRLDLISCRNVMIYLNRSAQERVMETFHFALNPGGYLFLGSSESVDGASDLYAPFNRDYHIFQSRQVAARTYPVPETTQSLHVDRFKMNQQLNQQPAAKTQKRITFGELHQQLLEQYAPPSVVINEEYDIVHLTEKAGKYLQIAGGEISQNLLKLVKPELRLELRSALYQSMQRQTAVEARGLKVSVGDKTETINIHVRPVLRPGDMARGYILVIFEPTVNEEKSGILLSSDEPLAKQLEEELTRLKLQLRSSGEQHEFQSEELKASNEELQAMNEELRSAAEELETSREELQSINEELRTVNQELKVKIEEVTITTDNLRNLVNSTDVGTIFLDRSFRVVLFTPAARNIFNLIPGDYGRPLSDITGSLEYDRLLDKAAMVLEKLVEFETEVHTKNNSFYLMRITPYRTDEDRIKGVVITFLNITERRKSEDVLRAAEEKYRSQQEHDVEKRTTELENSKDQYSTLVENTPDVITRWDKNLKLVFANMAFEGKMGVSNKNQLGKTFRKMGQPDEISIPYMNSLRKAFETGETIEHFNVFPTPNGEAQFYSRITPEKNAAGEIETVLSTARDITDIRKAEHDVLSLKEELAQRATDRYLELFNSIDEGFCIIEVLLDKNEKPFDYRFLEANKAFEKQTGLTNVIGKTMKEMVPKHEHYWFDIYGKVAKTGEPARFENEAKALGAYYEVYAFPAGKNLVAVLFNNIIERKKAEEALRISEERLRVTMESAVDYAIITTNTDGIIEGWNTGAERIFGYKEKEIKSKSADIIFTTEDRENNVPDKEMKTAREKGHAEDERWHRRKDGSRFYASGVMRPIYNPELSGYVKVVRDMTEQRMAEEQLRIFEERYRIALESAQMGAWDWNVQEDKVVWNEQHYLILGVKPDNKGKTENYFLQFVHPEDKEWVAAELMERANSGGIFNADFRIIRADNHEIRWMTGFGNTVKKEEGKAVRMVGVMFDITERKQLEQQKEEFISIASHELKTPVTSISVYGELLQEMIENNQSENTKPFIQKLNLQINRLKDLIKDLLDTTRISEGQLPLDYEEFNLIELVRQLTEDIQHSSNDHHLLFECDDTIIINGDKKRIEQVITNLISNAIKYSPNGGEIAITCKTFEKEVKISVKDEGIGITKDAQEKLFSRFYRVPEEKNTFPGWGLGLYIAAGIVQRHGGKMSVESIPGEGSIFSFTVPYNNKN